MIRFSCGKYFTEPPNKTNNRKQKQKADKHNPQHFVFGFMIHDTPYKKQ